MPDRRSFLCDVSAATLGLAFGGRAPALFASTISARGAAAAAPFTLPSLTYPPAALEPHIDAQTMTVHHDKHHQAYVTNLNVAMAQAPELQAKTLEQMLGTLSEVPQIIRQSVRDNGGGHWNHTLFWQLMAPDAGGEPGGGLGDAIRTRFGDFAHFRDQFAAAGLGRFGSGWVWLVRQSEGLTITSTPNQDCPLLEGKKPSTVLLGLDVWEHAYYLKYQNRRADYITAWWNVVNWREAERRFGVAAG